MRIPVHLGIALACAEVVLVTAATAQLPDPLETWITPPPGTGSFVQFGGPGIPPIPADFFGPGSEPFVGQIDFLGVEIDPPNLGSASTLVRRIGEPVLPTDPPGTSGTIPIEIVELRLRSASPIIVTENGGQNPQPWDVELDLSVNPQPQGTMTATKTHDNGGTFDAVLPVQPRFTFTRVENPGDIRILDTGLEGFPPNQLVIPGAPFVHAVNPALDVFVQPGAMFVPGVDEVIHGDPNSQVRAPFVGDDPGGVRHTVCAPTGPPAIPTVSQWGLIAIALLLVTAAAIVMRRRKAHEPRPAGV